MNDQTKIIEAVKRIHSRSILRASGEHDELFQSAARMITQLIGPEKHDLESEHRCIENELRARRIAKLQSEGKKLFLRR